MPVRRSLVVPYMVVSVCAALAVLLHAAPARAAEGKAPAAKDAPADPAMAEAKKASDAAVAAYKAKKYEEAAELWIKAYELNNKDSYLFNIGKAYDKLGNKDSAARYYARYAAATSDAKRRAKAEARVKALGYDPATLPATGDDAARKIKLPDGDLGFGTVGDDDDDDAKKPPPGDVLAPPGDMLEPMGDDDDDGSDDTDDDTVTDDSGMAAPDDMSMDVPMDEEPEKKKLGPFPFLTIGVGVAGVALGVVFGQLARGKASELEDLACAPGSSSCAFFYNGDKKAEDVPYRIHDAGRTFDTLQIVGYVVGGVFLATGLTVIVAGAAGAEGVRSGSAGPGVTASLAPVVGPGTLGASARVTF